MKQLELEFRPQANLNHSKTWKIRTVSINFNLNNFTLQAMTEHDTNHLLKIPHTLSQGLVWPNKTSERQKCRN